MNAELKERHKEKAMETDLGICDDIDKPEPKDKVSVKIPRYTKTSQKSSLSLEPIAVTRSFYSVFTKRLIDIVLSSLMLIGLSWLYLILFIAIKIDDPGPSFFWQKRVGKKKNRHISYFSLAKFRTMKMNTPHDVPTHMLKNPQQYITRIGRVLRKTSLDELPQIANVLMGRMSIVGPRPALWNQEDLVAEREKYGANDVTPGLTGWAQINGRDELEIPAKAKLDGEYAGNVTFKMDWTCFWMTIGSVLKEKGVVEGGTGVLVKKIDNRRENVNKTEE